MNELTPGLAKRLDAYLDRANDLADDGDFEAALAKFKAALALIPEPQLDYKETFGVLVALGDMQFLLDDFAGCRESLAAAVAGFKEAGKEPFVAMRLGQSLLELGQDAEARDWLARAHKAGGDKAFECEDPKYLAAIKA